MKKYLFLFLAMILAYNCTSKEQKTYYPVAFYNVENLFDTKNEPNRADEDFTPQGKFKWNEEKYNKKLNNISTVISELGKDKNNDGAIIVGLAEVENRRVIEDLLKQKKLATSNYRIIHSDSPDNRGIDVALIYNPTYFRVTSHKVYPYHIPGRNKLKTRDILVVSGKLEGENLSVIVNHWPSRAGQNSSPLRERAASICKQIADSIYKQNKNAKIVIMGDMNDDPGDISTRVVLGAKKNKHEVKEGGLYNTMWTMHDKGLGSLRYKGEWNLFDQIIISHSLLDNTQGKITFEKAEIFNKDYLIQKTGSYKGYPFRTFSGKTFINGYSDHFPTLIYLSKEKRNKKE